MDTTPITEVTTDKASEPVADDVENGDATIKSNGAEENNDEIDDEDEEDDIKAVEGEDEDTPMADETAGDMETENTEDASEGGVFNIATRNMEQGVMRTFAPVLHPYKDLLDNFELPKLSLTKIDKKDVKQSTDKLCHFVSTPAMFDTMLQQLKQEKELGMCIKYNRRTVATLCWILISTRECNFLVDTIFLQNSLDQLQEILLNKGIIKIMHGAENILKSLQLEYGLYFVNIFDTEIAMKKLNFQNTPLRQYIKKYDNAVLTKDHMLTAWHLRPMCKKYKKHALNSINFLIPIFVELTNKLIRAGLLESFLRDCHKCCEVIYQPVTLKDKVAYGPTSLTPGQSYVLDKLEDWRCQVAVANNVPLRNVLSDKILHKLAKRMILHKNYIINLAASEYVTKHIGEIHKMILEAREIYGKKGKGKPNEDAVAEDFIFYNARHISKPKGKSRYNLRKTELNKSTPKFNNCSTSGLKDKSLVEVPKKRGLDRSMLTSESDYLSKLSRMGKRSSVYVPSIESYNGGNLHSLVGSKTKDGLSRSPDRKRLQYNNLIEDRSSSSIQNRHVTHEQSSSFEAFNNPNNCNQNLEARFNSSKSSFSFSRNFEPTKSSYDFDDSNNRSSYFKSPERTSKDFKSDSFSRKFENTKSNYNLVVDGGNNRSNYFGSPENTGTSVLRHFRPSNSSFKALNRTDEDHFYPSFNHRYNK